MAWIEKKLKMSKFLDLPIEIQEQILQFTITVHNILTIKLVCKKFKLLVEKVFDHNCLEGKHFKWNIKNKHENEVKRLLQDDRIINEANNYDYFVYACGCGAMDVVKSLLYDPRIDPRINWLSKYILSWSVFFKEKIKKSL